MQKIKRFGQITIPKDIRDKLNLKDGDYVYSELTEAGILIYPVEIEIKKKAVE